MLKTSRGRPAGPPVPPGSAGAARLARRRYNCIVRVRGLHANSVGSLGKGHRLRRYCDPKPKVTGVWLNPPPLASCHPMSTG